MHLCEGVLLPLCTIYLLSFRTVLTVWYCFVLILLPILCCFENVFYQIDLVVNYYSDFLISHSN